MPRRREVPKREILPDPKHHSELLAKFINVLMISGKKSIAETVVYGALDVMEERLRKTKKADEDDDSGRSGAVSVLRSFESALDNIRPSVEVRSRRVGGATYQVPVEVRVSRREALAMRWLIQFARKRSGRTMSEKLANELIEASHNRGGAIRKKEDVHRMAEANKAFSHYRW